MKQIINLTLVRVATVVAGVSIIFALAWQSMITFVQKGLADSRSIRVSETNACSSTESNSDKPHFTGCNSIL